MKSRSASLLIAICLASTVSLASADERPTSLEDICPADADPCEVKKHWDISNLPFDVDFGLRTVRVSGTGAFDANGVFNTGVSCGRFEAAPGTLSPIFLAGEPAVDKTPGGRMTIRAYRGCSDSPASRCLNDADCAAGTCSVGDGSIVLRGQVLGNAADSARLTLSAAGPVEVHGNVQLSGKNPAVEEFSDGGELVISSTTGPVVFDGNLKARAQQYGGTLAITTGGHVIIDSKITLAATYFAGSVEINAGGDVQIDGRIVAPYRNETGDPGHVTIVSGGNIVLGETGLLIDLDGGLYSGVVQATASNNIELKPEGALEFRDGALSAGNDVLLYGHIDARSSGTGGTVDLVATRDVLIDEQINVAGNHGGGGEITVSAGRTLTVNGDLKTKGRTLAGGISLSASTILFSGVIDSKGASDGDDVHLTACNISLLPLSKVEVTIPGSGLHTTSSGQLTVAAGAHVTAPADGVHVFEYLDGGPAPIVVGDVEPDATLLPASLAPCP